VRSSIHQSLKWKCRNPFEALRSEITRSRRGSLHSCLHLKASKAIAVVFQAQPLWCSALKVRRTKHKNPETNSTREKTKRGKCQLSVLAHSKMLDLRWVRLAYRIIKIIHHLLQTQARRQTTSTKQKRQSREHKKSLQHESYNGEKHIVWWGKRPYLFIWMGAICGANPRV